MNKQVLDISHLHLSYDSGKNYILKDISFSLNQGEILSIIGKNGAGKSSLLKAVAGIEQPYSGTIERKTQHISYIPQKIFLEKSFPLRVEEFFRIFNPTASQAYIGEISKLFGMEGFFLQNIHTLSGGEFQKILIINALISKPNLLLLDEATSGIDISGEEEFYKNIQIIKKKYPDIAIILVSHNLHLVYKNSSRVICLHENNLCCHGSPSELKDNETIKHIFGEYLTAYEHAPHSTHHHTH